MYSEHLLVSHVSFSFPYSSSQSLPAPELENMKQKTQGRETGKMCNISINHTQ